MPINKAISEEPIVDIQNVSIRYGSNPEVLSDIKLSLARGSFLLC